MRLYLAASVAYFLIAAGTPSIRLESGQSLFLGLHIGGDTLAHKPSTDAERIGIAARESIQRGGITAAERAAALEEIARAPTPLRPLFRRVVEDPIGFRRSIFTAMPRMLFVLLPLFAIIVAMFYRGRRYPEHLYFALHLHSFIFFALGVSALSKYPQIPIVAVLGGLTALVWIPRTRHSRSGACMEARSRARSRGKSESRSSTARPPRSRSSRRSTGHLPRSSEEARDVAPSSPPVLQPRSPAAPEPRSPGALNNDALVPPTPWP